MNEINENTQINEIPANLEPASSNVLEASDAYVANTDQQYLNGFQSNPRRRKTANLMLGVGTAGITAAAATGLYYGQDPVNQAYTKVALPAILIEAYEEFINPDPKPLETLFEVSEQTKLGKPRINIPGIKEEDAPRILGKILDSLGTEAGRTLSDDDSIIKKLTTLFQNPDKINVAPGLDLGEQDIKTTSKTLFGQEVLPNNAYINTVKESGDVIVKLARELSFARALRAIPKALNWEEGVQHADEISFFLYSNPILFLGSLGAGALFTAYRLNRFLRNRDRRKAEKLFIERQTALTRNAQGLTN